MNSKGESIRSKMVGFGSEFFRGSDQDKIHPDPLPYFMKSLQLSFLPALHFTAQSLTFTKVDIQRPEGDDQADLPEYGSTVLEPDQTLIQV